MKPPLPPTAAPFWRPLALLLLLGLGLSFLGGCAPFRKISRDVFGAGGDLKKKVAITVLENRTRRASADLLTVFQQALAAKAARACADVLLMTPEDKTFPAYLKNPPRLPSGLLDDFNVAATGRKYGYNAIVTGMLLEIRIDEEASGFGWFRGSRPFVELVAGVEVLDTETGAKILDRRFSQKNKLAEDAFESLHSDEIGADPVLVEPLQRMANEIGESVCDAISEQPWKGYIISVSADKVVLSSSRDTGLAPGDLLEVYDSTRTVTGYAGQQFFLPGLKTGEIKITAVYPNRSEAVVVSGDDIREGCSVKRK